MKRFEFSFHCPDGEYHLLIKNEDSFLYEVNSSIAGFINKKAALDEETAAEFCDLLKKCKLASWEAYYGEGKLVDACIWEVACDDYHSKGEESYEPYNYHYLLDALALIEEKSDYFRV